MNPIAVWITDNTQNDNRSIDREKLAVTLCALRRARAKKMAKRRPAVGRSKDQRVVAGIVLHFFAASLGSDGDGDGDGEGWHAGASEIFVCNWRDHGRG